MPATSTPNVIIQQQNTPLCMVQLSGQKPIPPYITNEWRRPLELMAQIVNSQAATITALQARLTAAGIP